MQEVAKRAPIMDFGEMRLAAEMMAASGLFPQWNSQAKVMTLMLLCRAEGSDPITAVNRYDNIQGRVAKKPQAMLDDFISAGGKVDWEETTEEVARASFVCPNGLEHTEAFTIEDAKRAGLVQKDNWRKYPKAMLRARCISAAMRAVFPGATNLMHTPEEIEDSVEAPALTTACDAPPLPALPAAVVEPSPDLDMFDARIGELDQERTVAYLQGIHWLEEGQGLQDLNDGQKLQIVGRFESFKERVGSADETDQAA